MTTVSQIVALFTLLHVSGYCVALFETLPSRPHFGRDVSPLHNSRKQTALLLVTRESSSDEKHPPVSLSSRSVAALSILNDKRRQSRFPLERLEESDHYLALEQRDRAFARNLVATTERRMGQIIKILALCQNKKSPQRRRSKRQDLLVDACLQIGVTQLLFLNVPDHAALKETVDVLKHTPSVAVPEAKIKFVNAVLRRIAREGHQMLRDHTAPADNVAPWLLRNWEEEWGCERTNQIVESFLKPPSTYLTVDIRGVPSSTMRQHLEEVASALGPETIILPNGSLRVSSNMKGPVNSWPLFDQGRWWVQDISASLPALALSNAFGVTDLSDLHVVDMCAAPGGKTAQLVSRGFGKVTAVEASEPRSNRLVENLHRLHMKCDIVVDDGSKWVPTDGCVDGILLDVPCSATGTGAKRPDVLRKSKDMDQLLDTQARLARHCVDNILEPGGVLIYASCSILKAEGEDQVEALLCEREEELEAFPFQRGDIPGFDAAIDENGWLRILPGSLLSSSGFDCDGFFIARMRRI